MFQLVSQPPERLAAIGSVEVYMDETESTGIRPSAGKRGVEFTFRACFVAGATSQQFWQLVVSPGMDFVETPVARMQEPLGAIPFVIQNDRDRGKPMANDRR